MQKKVQTIRQAALKIKKIALQLRKRRAMAVSSGMEKTLKEAAVSWKAMAFPQWLRPKTAVIRGMALGKYMPAPSPINREATAREVYVVEYLRKNCDVIKIKKPSIIERL